MNKKKYPGNFLARCQEAGFGTPAKEFRFHPERRWRFDWAWNCGVAIEIDGGGWIEGRHNREVGRCLDNEKRNVAQSMGWIVLVFSPAQIADGSFMMALSDAMAYRLCHDSPFSDSQVIGVPTHCLTGVIDTGAQYQQSEEE